MDNPELSDNSLVFPAIGTDLNSLSDEEARKLIANRDALYEKYGEVDGEHLWQLLTALTAVREAVAEGKKGEFFETMLQPGKFIFDRIKLAK